MGWMILIVVVVLLLMGFVRGFYREQELERGDSNERSEDGDDRMLEDWYASQELDDDLDEWDR